MKRLHNIVKRGDPIYFTFDGKRIKAYQNETVGMAIFASGIKVLSRSIKYHRPRSLFCSTGNCHRCLMEIDGIPNRFERTL